MFILSVATLSVRAQNSFSSGSDGSDGALDLTGTAQGTTVLFDPATFPGDQHQLGIFNFTQITIPSGVTLKLSGNKVNTPMYWLSQGDVDIEGTLDLSGADGASYTTNLDLRLPAVPGSGGYAGGLGGSSATGQTAATAGNGPGGGAPGTCSPIVSAGGGTITVNRFLVPLVGGSGGGAVTDPGGILFQAGGGAGGGAILIASSTQIIVNGAITANGGSAGNSNQPAGCVDKDGDQANAAGGSGGAVRLVSNTISGSGRLSSAGGLYSGPPGSSGDVRLEAFTIGFTGTVNAAESTSTPIPLFLPTTAPPWVQVTSINGTPITENPFSFPDIQLNTASAVNIVITGHQVPVGTVPTLYVFSDTTDQVLTCPAGLQGTLDTTTCTISIAFPFGGSRGFVKATWSSSGSSPSAPRKPVKKSRSISR